MKVTILGAGGAGGVPTIGSGWGRCDPAEPRNARLRPSVLIEENGQTILVDAGPDLRTQLLRAGVRHLDAVLFTHAHADHIHGIDDLREVNRAMRAPIRALGSTATLEAIEDRFGYALEPFSPGDGPIYRPWLLPEPVDGRFTVGQVEIDAFDQDHGYSRSTGFRVGGFAYTTDARAFPAASFAMLNGLDLWIVGCLTDHPHETHAHVDLVVDWAKQLRPRRTVLTHMSPRLDYGVLKTGLPAGIEPGYDGQTFAINSP